jgi:GNAT superfamily N-acetyltransferase
LSDDRLAAIDEITIRPLAAGDRDVWFPLWQGYLDFYDAKLDPRISDNTWRRLLDPHEPMYGLVADGGQGRLVGILNYVLHANTWSDRPVCYLEDLFVDPAMRGQGAGRALIEGLAALAKGAKWRRVYWMTREGNATARALYDRIATATDWVRYDIDIPL